MVLKKMKMVSLLLVVALLVGMTPVHALSYGKVVPPFPDVIGTKYQDAVGLLNHLGVAGGMPGGKFEPEGLVTRAQMAAFAVRAMGKQNEVMSGSTIFSDVPATHWANTVIGVAASYGIVEGVGGGLFKPDDHVTYAQAAAMILRVVGQYGTVQGAWPVGVVVRATELGLIEGTNFNTNGPASRGDIALMLAKGITAILNPITGKTLAETVFATKMPLDNKIAKIVITPADVTVSKGVKHQFSAVAYNAQNQVVETTIGWSLAGDVGVLNPEGLFVGTKSGKGEIRATAGGVTGKTSVTVTGEPAAIMLTATPSTVPANGRTAVTIEARVVDSAGNVVNAGVDTLQFFLSASNLGVLSSTQVGVINGRASVTFTPSLQAGTVQIMATAPGLSVAGGSASVTTTVPVISKIELTAYPHPLAADGVSQSILTATLTDAAGGEVLNNTANTILVTLNSSSGAAGSLLTNTIAIPPGQSKGTAVFRSSNSIGSSIIYGSSIYPVAPVAVSTVMVGPAAQVKFRAGSIKETVADGISEMTVQVEVRDANGNVRTGDNGTVVFLSATSGNHTLTVYPSSTTNGVATFKLKTTVAGTYNLKAWASSVAGASDEISATFMAGPPSKLVLSVEPTNNIAADTVSTVNLVAKVTDAFGNPVPTYTVNVTFSKSVNNNATTMPPNTTVTTVEGIARLPVTSTSSVGTDLFTATAPGLTTQGSMPVTTRITGVPVRLAVQPVSSINVGQTTTIRVHVLDALNQVVTSANDRVITLIPSSSFISISGPAKTVAGVATFTVTSTRAEAVQFTAQSAGLTSDTIGQVLTINPGQGSHIVLKATPDGVAADGVSRATITGVLVDSYGNTVGSGQTVNLSLNTTAHGTLNSNYLFTGSSVQFVANTTPGSVTITGTNNNYPVTPIVINTYQVGVPTQVAVEPVAPVVAGNAFANQMVVRVRILDAAGRLVSSLNTGQNALSAVGLTVTGNSGNTTTISIGGSHGLAERNFYANGTTMGSASVVNGVATFAFTNTRAETVTFTPVAYYQGQALASVSGTGTTIPGQPAALKLNPVTTTIPATAEVPLAVTASITDIHGNIVSGVADTITFSASSDNFLTMPATRVLATSNASATIQVKSKVHPTGGVTVITATGGNTGLVGTSTIITDMLPGQPVVWATDENGNDTVISLGEQGARVTVTVPVRQSNQKIIVYVNGVLVNLYTTIGGDTLVDTVPAGSTTLVGYIKRAELGSFGMKEIRAISSTNLGLSPISAPVYVNLSN